MDRFSTDHPDQIAVARAQLHPLADQHARVPAAHLAEPEVAVVLDVGDVEADLVDVAHDGDPWAVPGSTHDGVRRSDPVATHFGGERRAVFPPEEGGTGFVA